MNIFVCVLYEVNASDHSTVNGTLHTTPYVFIHESEEDFYCMNDKLGRQDGDPDARAYCCC